MDIQKIYWHKKPINTMNMLSPTAPTTLRCSHKHQTLFLANFQTLFPLYQISELPNASLSSSFYAQKFQSSASLPTDFCISYHRWFPFPSFNSQQNFYLHSSAPKIMNSILPSHIYNSSEPAVYRCMSFEIIHLTFLPYFTAIHKDCLKISSPCSHADSNFLIHKVTM